METSKKVKSSTQPLIKSFFLKKTTITSPPTPSSVLLEPSPTPGSVAPEPSPTSSGVVFVPSPTPSGVAPESSPTSNEVVLDPSPTSNDAVLDPSPTPSSVALETSPTSSGVVLVPSLTPSNVVSEASSTPRSVVLEPSLPSCVVDDPSPSSLVFEPSPSPSNIYSGPSCSRRASVEVESEDVVLNNLPSDPRLRKRISEYHPNIRDDVRRAYLLRGPCQPGKQVSPLRKKAKRSRSQKKKVVPKISPLSEEKLKVPRSFSPNWFTDFEDWLEYSVTKKAVFCLYCYLFKENNSSQGGGDAFTHSGYSNWKKKSNVWNHVGQVNSVHNQAYQMGQDLLNGKQHVGTIIEKQSDQSRIDYRIRLQATVDCIRFLLSQGLAFRGNDEVESSTNPGNFLALLKYTADHNLVINNVVLSNAPHNFKLTSPLVQKRIVNAFSIETTNSILSDLGDSFFSVLVDESRDVSIKEQMAVVIRYVDKRGCVIERFLGVVHVNQTSAISLKEAIEGLFSKHSLSISSLRGQGYDGASNMKGEINGLKALILKDNASAFYVHCFAHQLQLVLVTIARKEPEVASFFGTLLRIVNVAGASCKRRDILRDKHAAEVAKALDDGELSTGKGLNQELAIKRPGDTRWSSHYEAIVNLMVMFSSVIEVIEDVAEDGSSEQRGEACNVLAAIKTFGFIFKLFFMKRILGITNALSKALQKKDQDIVNAMALIRVTKLQLQTLRNDGWASLLDEVSAFCIKHNILVPKMEDGYLGWRRTQKQVGATSNWHFYYVNIFIKVMDWQSQELNERFDEVSTELLLCVACLSPCDLFSSFDKSKLIRLAQFYPVDFSDSEIMRLSDELETYIIDVRSDTRFSDVVGIGGLAKMMVETKKKVVYPLVYLLLSLALVLPIATATVERVFSAMRIIKNRLRNRMGDEWMNDCMVTYIEKEVFGSVDLEAVMQRYQKMTNHRQQL